jgi:predicted RNA-binding Zn-ribbon protein involved in translation (DUF1610 family)
MSIIHVCPWLVLTITKNKRGRTRKHRWIEFPNIEQDSSQEALYLKWASINNPALAQCGRYGCPQCGKKVFRLRHDKKFANIRFYCPNCRFETSYHIIRPKRNFRPIEVHDERGILIGVKTVDDYHEKTPRENADLMVMNAEQKKDLGGEWFDGISGTNSQSRYSTREEILKRIEERRTRRLMEAALEETEREEQENRTADFRAEISGRRARDVID